MFVTKFKKRPFDEYSTHFQDYFYCWKFKIKGKFCCYNIGNATNITANRSRIADTLIRNYSETLVLENF